MPAAFAAVTPLTLSSMTRQRSGATPRSLAASRNRSGAGLPRFTRVVLKTRPSNRSQRCGLAQADFDAFLVAGGGDAIIGWRRIRRPRGRRQPAGGPLLKEAEDSWARQSCVKLSAEAGTTGHSLVILDHCAGRPPEIAAHDRRADHSSRSKGERISTRVWQLIVSLSTSTPSQSRMTRSKGWRGR